MIKPRSEWGWRERTARYICFVSAIAGVVLAWRLLWREQYGFLLLLMAASIILTALASAPHILLGLSAQAKPKHEELPGVVAWALAHAALFLIVGIALAWLLAK